MAYQRFGDPKAETDLYIFESIAGLEIWISEDNKIVIPNGIHQVTAINLMKALIDHLKDNGSVMLTKGKNKEIVGVRCRAKGFKG